MNADGGVATKNCAFCFFVQAGMMRTSSELATEETETDVSEQTVKPFWEAGNPSPAYAYAAVRPSWRRKMMRMMKMSFLFDVVWA